MTVKELVNGWYPDERAIIERYLDSIQPFSVEPSETHEYDGTFTEQGRFIYTGVVLKEFGDKIEDMCCGHCGDGLCLHLAATLLSMDRQGL